MPVRSKYYFISDVHLGVCGYDSRALEHRFVTLLKQMREDAVAVYLLGDIFDFWYEYKYTIPRGVTRTLGAIAELCDSGVQVFYVPGNHDVWLYDYFQKEIGVSVLHEPVVAEIGGKRFCVGHGDSAGKSDFGFRFVRWMFHNRFLQVLFSAVHPRWAFGIGYAWAAHSRKIKDVVPRDREYVFRGVEEPLYKFAAGFGKEYFAQTGRSIDYYIFGHYHTPGRIAVSSGGELQILGCWVDGGEYAVFDGERLLVETMS